MQRSVCRTAHRAVPTEFDPAILRGFQTAETRLRLCSVRAAKKARRVENRTVLLVRCGELVGLRQRPGKRVSSPVQELPSLDGHLSPDELHTVLTEMGWSVRKLLSLRPARHIFTHVEWHMNGVYVELDAPAPALTFVTPAELRDAYALPSAFRSFVSVLED